MRAIQTGLDGKKSSNRSEVDFAAVLRSISQDMLLSTLLRITEFIAEISYQVRHIVLNLLVIGSKARCVTVFYGPSEGCLIS
jgi:hypothetical protein